MYSIGQLSKRTNISIRTLRYYDEIGLLKPAKVAESGYRYYSRDEIRLLQHITALKELGFTLASIREMLAAESGSQEQRWRSYLDLELAAVADEKRRLDKMEKLLLTARHALEMKGELDPDDIFLFIQALQPPADARDAFLTKHFTEREIRIIKSLPDLSSDDPRSMEWARLMRQVKEHLHEEPSSDVSRRIAERIVETTMAWFEHDEQLLDKYWRLIRPEPGQGSKVFGLDAEAMDYIDRIVDRYLEHGQEAAPDGGQY